jgi:hypothetical protein
VGVLVFVSDEELRRVLSCARFVLFSLSGAFYLLKEPEKG